MINELKAQVEKTFGQKIVKRQHAELLAQDIYLKTNILMSYNTLRRFFGMVSSTKPRQSTLDYLSRYCGFIDYIDFTRKFPAIDIWPKWESLFLSLESLGLDALISHLTLRKVEHQDFAVSFSFAVKELLNIGRGADALRLFRTEAFQFANLSFDDASQIGVILGLHFTHYDNWEIEKSLLHEKNFRDLVLKTNVDYTRFNAKYGKWINYLLEYSNLDADTAQFIRSIKPFMYLLNCQTIPTDILAQIPPLRATQHPILYGRIFSLKLMLSSDETEHKRIILQMKKRLSNSPHLKAELLYVPAIHALLTQNSVLNNFTVAELQELPIAEKWYQISLIAIEKIAVAARKLKMKQYDAALKLIESSPIEQIRFGYKHIVDCFITFFLLHIARQQAKEIPTDQQAPLTKNIKNLQKQLQEKLTKVNLPLLSEAYFKGYFDD